MAVTTAHSPTTSCTWELTGPPLAPLVVALGGISAHRHVCHTEGNGQPGWWDGVVGAGLALDTRHYRVLGIDWHSGSETITTADQADQLAVVLDELGINAVHSIVGASYGGMVALAFAARYPDRVGRLTVIAAAHQTHPMATAHRVIQRRIIRLGLAAGLPSEGVALARALGMTTYRTAEEFVARFEPTPDPVSGAFPVEGYLDHGSRRFASTWEPDRYLTLSESLDLHYVDPEQITVPLDLLGFHEDTLVPAWQLEELAAKYGGPCRLELASSIYGHDGFLKEVAVVGQFIGLSLESEVRHAA